MPSAVVLHLATKLASGRAREVGPGLLTLAALYAVHYVFGLLHWGPC